MTNSTKTTGPCMFFPAVTGEQLRALRSEAAEAGDMAQVEMCDRAMDGNDDAANGCARAIAAARAMHTA